MTDELTPEERDALRGLPKERMPSAELEGRVVGALRGRGVLAQRRRRTFEITNGRVVGIVAACAALVIGGYSIGLNRGGTETLPVAPSRERKAPVKNEPAATPDVKALEEAGKANETDELREAGDAPAALNTREDFADKATGFAGSKEKDALAPQASAPKLESPPSPEAVARRSAQRELETVMEEAEPAPAADTQKGRLQSMDVAAPPLEEPVVETEEAVTEVAPTAAFKQDADVTGFAETLTFLLNGIRVEVDIPSGVRIDKQRSDTIVIYTTNGPIRLRVAVDND